MNRELQRSAVKNILQELSDNSIPVTQIMATALIEDWSEERMQKEVGKAMKDMDLTKTFDYYADRIMSVFTDEK